MTRRTPPFSISMVIALMVASPAALAQTPQGRGRGNSIPGPAGKLIAQANQSLLAGRDADVPDLVRKAVEASPESFQVNNRAGVFMALVGQYATARTYFARALERASGQQERVSAIRNMTMSYAFENDCKQAVASQTRAYDLYLEARDFYMVGEMANEVARVCLEAGDYDRADAWYRKGYEQGLKQPDIGADRKDLWEFRWEHAQARIAARRGNTAEAARHVAAAGAVLDRKAIDPAQELFYPYLVGYVAYYARDFRTALAELQKANQNDPFIQALIAQTYEQLGDKVQALSYYRKAAATTGHNPPAAYARPLARKKLGVD